MSTASLRGSLSVLGTDVQHFVDHMNHPPRHKIHYVIGWTDAASMAEVTAIAGYLVEFARYNNFMRQVAYNETREQGKTWNDAYERQTWAQAVSSYIGSFNQGSSISVTVEDSLVNQFQNATNTASRVLQAVSNPLAALRVTPQESRSWLLTQADLDWTKQGIESDLYPHVKSQIEFIPLQVTADNRPEKIGRAHV